MKKQLLTFIILFSALALSAQYKAYWRGGAGNYNDPTKWSNTSGGGPGTYVASNGGNIPVAGDSIVFDNNSAATASFVVTVPANAQCANFKVTSACARLNINVANGIIFQIYGHCIVDKNDFQFISPGSGILEFYDQQSISGVGNPQIIRVAYNPAVYPQKFINTRFSAGEHEIIYPFKVVNNRNVAILAGNGSTVFRDSLLLPVTNLQLNIGLYTASANSGIHTFHGFVSAGGFEINDNNTVSIREDVELRRMALIGANVTVTSSPNRHHIIGNFNYSGANGKNVDFSNCEIKTVFFATFHNNSGNIFTSNGTRLQFYTVINSKLSAANTYFIANTPIMKSDMLSQRKAVLSSTGTPSVQSIHVFANEFQNMSSNTTTADSLLIYGGNVYLQPTITSFAVSPAGHFKAYPGTYLQSDFSPKPSLAQSTIRLAANTTKFDAPGRCDSTIRFRDMHFNFVATPLSSTCSNLILENSSTSVTGGLSAGVFSYVIPGSGNSGWILGATPAPRILRWTGTTTPANTMAYRRWHNSVSWQNVTTGVTPECPPTIYDSVIFPANSYVRIDGPIAVCKGMHWQGTGVLYDSANVVAGTPTSTISNAPVSPANTSYVKYDNMRSLEIYGTTTLTKPGILNWEYKGRVYFRAWQARQYLDPGQQKFRNSVVFDATSDLGGWELRDSLYAHYSYQGQWGVPTGTDNMSTIMSTGSANSMVHYNGHLNTNNYAVRVTNYVKCNKLPQYESSLKLANSKFYIIGKSYGTTTAITTANFFVERSTKFRVITDTFALVIGTDIVNRKTNSINRIDTSEIIFCKESTFANSSNTFFGGGYKYYNLKFKSDRGGISIARNITSPASAIRAYTDTFNVVKFENGAVVFSSITNSGQFATNVPPLTENIIAKRIHFNDSSGITEIGNSPSANILPSYTRSPLRIKADSVYYNGNAWVDTATVTYNKLSVMRPGKIYNFYYSKHYYPTTSIMQGLGLCSNPITLNKGIFYNNSGADFENPAIHLTNFNVGGVSSLGSDSLIFINSMSSAPNTGKADIHGGGSRVLVWRDNTAGASTGLWTDDANWALATITSTNTPMNGLPFSYTVGAVGQCVPSCLDTVIFDDLSFDANDVVHIPDNYTAYFHTMRWATQTGITPTFSVSMRKGSKIQICGSLFLQNNLNFNNSAYTLFTGRTVNDTIDAKGKVISNYVTRFESLVDNVNWTLKSDAQFAPYTYTTVTQPGIDSVNLQLVRGHLNLNGKLLQTAHFWSTGSLSRMLSLPTTTVGVTVSSSTLQIGGGITPSSISEVGAASTGVTPSVQNGSYHYLIDDGTTNTFTLNAAPNSLLLFERISGTFTTSFSPSVKYGNNYRYGHVVLNRVSDALNNGNCRNTQFESMTINSSTGSINTTNYQGFGTSISTYIAQNTNNYIKKFVSNNLSLSGAVNINASGTRIDSLVCSGGVNILDTTAIMNYYKFVPGCTYLFPHSKVTYLGDNCDFKPIGTIGNNILFRSTLSGSTAWIRKDTGLVCADYCSVVDNWAIGSGKTMPAFTTGGTFPGGSGIAVGACTQPNISRCDTVLASSYYTVTNSGPTLNASPAQNFGKRGIFNGGINFTIGSNTFGWEKTPNPPTPRVSVISPNITICEGDSLRVTFQIEGFGPFKDFVFFTNTNVGGGYPIGSNVSNFAPANIGIPSYTATPSFTYHPGVFPGDSIKPADPTQPYSTFGTTANPWVYSFWIHPTQSTKYSLGTIGVDRCFNAVSATGFGAMVVTVNAAPKNIAGSVITNPICSNANAVITGTATLTGNTYYLYDMPTGFSGQQVMTSATTGTLTTGSHTVTSLTTGTTATTYTYYIGAESQLGCPSLIRVPVTVTVNPVPQITNTGSQSICTGNTATISPVNNFVTGVSNNWTSLAVAGITGHATSGTSNISETLINTTTNPLSLVYTYTPTAGNCSGARQQFTVVVNPAPTMSSPTSTTICSGNALNFNFNTNIPGTTFNWIANDNFNTTGETTSNQNTSVINDGITNNTSTLQQVFYTVVPTGTAGACTGVAQTVTVNVNPIPQITSPTTATICSGTALNIPLSANVSSTYTWIASSNANVSGESLSNQTTNTINNTLSTIAGNLSETVYYNVMPVSSAAGCPGISQQLTVTVNSLPAVTAVSSSSAICSNQTATLTAGGANTYTWTSGPVSSIYTTSSAGVYTVTGIDANNCRNTQTVNLVVNNLPNVTASASSASVCAGSTATLTAGGASSYTWTSGPTSSTYTTSAAGVYTVTGTDLNNCVNTRTVSLSVNALPTVTATASSTAICAGNTATLTAGGASTYTWTGGSVSPTYLASSTGVYTVTGADANNCLNTRTVSLTVNSLPAVTATTSSSAICSNQTATLTAGGASTYTWTSGPVSSTYTTSSAGIYTVTGIDANNCRNTQTVNLVVNTLPTITALVSSTSICVGNNATLTAGGANTYSWTSPASTNTIITVSPASTTIYTVTGTDLNNCTNTRTVSLTVNQLPSITASTITNVSCYNQNNGSVSFINTLGTPGYTVSGTNVSGTTAVNLSPNNYTYTVTDAAGCVNTTTLAITQPTAALLTTAAQTSSNTSCTNADGVATITITGGTSGYTINPSSGSISGNTITGLGTGIHSYTVTDYNNCTTVNSVTITGATGISSSITGQSDVLCYGNTTASITVNGTGETSGTYNYTLTNIGTSLDVASNNTGIFTNLPAGNYSVHVVGGISNCVSNQNITISQPTAPLSLTGITANSVICNGGTAQVTSTVTGGTAPYSYLWSGANTSTTSIATYTAGIYNVQITDANGCSLSVQNFTVNEAPVLNVNSVATTTTGCGLSNATAAISVSGGWSSYTYTITDNTNAVISNTNTATGLSAGTYSVSVADGLGCATQTVFTITNPSTPTINVVSNTPEICVNQTATLTPSGAVSYTLVNTGEVFTSSAMVNPTSTTVYQIVGTDASNCISAPLSMTVTVNELPNINVSSASAAICVGNTTTLTANITGTTTVDTYTWSTGISASNTEVVSPTSQTVYTVAGTNTLTGCVSAMQSVTVNVNQLPSITASTITNVSCYNQNNGSVSFTNTLGTPGYTISGTNVSGTTAVNLSPNNYTYTVTDAAGCVNTTTLAITQPTAALLTTAAQTGSNTSCTVPDGVATLTITGGTGSTYTITASSGVAIGNTITGLNTGVHTYTVSDQNSCSAVSSVTIAGATGITSNISAQSDVLCMGGATGSVSVSGLGEAAGLYSFTLSPITGTTVATSNTTGNFTGLSAGTYSVLIMGDVSNCISTENITITEPSSALSLTGITANSVICNGATAQVTATVTGGTGSYTYVWSANTSTISTATYTAGIYSVDISDANGCALATQNFTVDEAPVLTINSIVTQTSSCGVANGSATITAVDGWSSSYTYSVNGVSQPTNVVTGLAAGSYTANVSDALGCSTQTVFTISNPVTPTLSIAANPAAICVGSTITLTPNGASSYTLNGTTSFTTDVVLNPTTTTVVAITGTDASGCVSAPLNVTVTVNNLPVITVAASNTTICEGNITTLTASTTGSTSVDTYNWSTSETTSSITVSPASATIYTVVGTNTLTGCVSAIQSVTIAVNATPTVAITSQTNVLCFGNNNGEVSIATNASSPVITPGTTGLSAGVYTFTITDNSTLCSNTVTASITGPAAALGASIVGATANTSCNTANGAFTVTATGGTPNYTYNTTNTNGVFTNQGTGTQTIIVADANGCTTSVSVAISGVNTPSISSVTQNNVSCNGLSNGSAVVNVSGGTSPFVYSWTNSASTGNSISNVSPNTYIVTITDAGNCVVSQTVVITEPNAINVITTHVTEPCVGQTNGSAAIEISGGTPTYSVTWNPTSSVDNTANTSIISDIREGSYVATVTDANGCNYQYPIVLKAADGVGCNFFIPEIFSPNGDGKNDSWEIKGLDNYPNNSVTVFNRWGDQVFTANPYRNDWNGVNAGDKSLLGKGPLPVGTYYFILDLGNGDKPITGYVQLTK